MKEVGIIAILLVTSIFLGVFAIMNNDDGTKASDVVNKEKEEVYNGGKTAEQDQATNELAAKVGLAIGKKGYSSSFGGIEPEILPNNIIELNFLVGEDLMNNENSKQEVQEIAKKVIERNNYDVDSYQINFIKMDIDNDGVK
ncbi:hypothetical protein [Oceanobacillus halophilus]|uniref:Uncharacterized protein n=1 Tax=Oceanobacillus halophilus TaxID=930130 RepID=A0A495A1A0_9BACI|nr:hypothetical protein [Oceanobacillus halophilus]RKQ33238.1 hypothetical protein D8M06_10710 [Oceanobacillus halophilus]